MFPSLLFLSRPVSMLCLPGFPLSLTEPTNPPVDCRPPITSPLPSTPSHTASAKRANGAMPYRSLAFLCYHRKEGRLHDWRWSTPLQIACHLVVDHFRLFLRIRYVRIPRSSRFQSDRLLSFLFCVASAASSPFLLPYLGERIALFPRHSPPHALSAPTVNHLLTIPAYHFARKVGCPCIRS